MLVQRVHLQIAMVDLALSRASQQCPRLWLSQSYITDCLENIISQDQVYLWLKVSLHITVAQTRPDIMYVCMYVCVHVFVCLFVSTLKKTRGSPFCPLWEATLVCHLTKGGCGSFSQTKITVRGLIFTTMSQGAGWKKQGETVSLFKGGFQK